MTEVDLGSIVFSYSILDVDGYEMSSSGGNGQVFQNRICCESIRQDFPNWVGGVSVFFAPQRTNLASTLLSFTLLRTIVICRILNEEEDEDEQDTDDENGEVVD